ncbi:MAG: hypothetical protein O9319_12160 [Gemmatimonas sp.]|jgi:hypothetical protein|uniref:PGN_0703 family putative restriction endonuclease n=1 Tax=Gemmatimonas sp. TaxID=1962908 RepID=UPI0022C98518|nr:hypothetical protein [Gemmatimonas sp.]MCZ8013660.1 hypothetical protein [Gemmatimonas sp.]MCZ8267601.1 hypothetical protein [Gemmatimonas sp.]
MTRSPLSGVEQAQRLWARNAGLHVDDRGYLLNVHQNLFGGLSDEVKAEFEQADGSELVDWDGRPAKMRAVISSSALAVNVFQHWKLNDPAPIGRALGLPSAATDITFEQRMHTGAGGTPPNLDVVIKTSDGGIVGVECKFTEWMTRKTGQAASMAPYFRGPETLWARANLPECERLAREMNDGKKAYQYLDGPQLLKHILGLHKSGAPSLVLFYVWYEVHGEVADQHRSELAAFSERIRSEVTFRSLSYQQIGGALCAMKGLDSLYRDYIASRYGLDEPAN